MRVNPRNRKVKASVRPALYLTSAEQITALLAAAKELDAEAVKSGHPDRAAVPRYLPLSTLVFSGLRIGEALNLRWRHLDMSRGRLTVPGTKTSAAARTTPLLPPLREALLLHRAKLENPDPDALVFTTHRGGPMSKDNTRRRILGAAIARADEWLIKRGYQPLPEKLNQHSLRHTYISLRVAVGDDLPRIALEASHANIGVTYRIYTHIMGETEEDRARLRALVQGEHVEIPDLSPAGVDRQPRGLPAPGQRQAA